MINHARTLLLNRTGGKQNLRDLGEEYIPADFVSQNLPSWLEAYQQALFGADPEHIYQNFQVGRILRLLHATEYEPYLRLFDDRITYDPRAAGPFAEIQYGYSFTSSADKVIEVIRVGDVPADDSRGLMRYRWTISMTNQVAIITNMRTSRAVSINIISPPASNSVSDILTLPGSIFKVRLRVKPPYSVAAWDDNLDIVLLTRPARSLPETLVELEALRGFERNLFGAEVAEPYHTFFSLWRTAKTLPEQLAGIVLALAFRLHRNYRTRTG